MYYLDVIARKGGKIERPNIDQECLVFVHSGNLEIGGNSYKTGDFVLLDDESVFIAKANTRCLVFGGDKWQTTPHLYWNFVAFDQARIEQAKDDWRNQRFPKIPGDDLEFTPLPD
jgi:redox-sensitive bicupin YhaK (pirin superfamily)